MLPYRYDLTYANRKHNKALLINNYFWELAARNKQITIINLDGRQRNLFTEHELIFQGEETQHYLQSFYR